MLQKTVVDLSFVISYPTGAILIIALSRNVYGDEPIYVCMYSI